MPTDITMPKLSDTMTEGVLVQWRKNVGERVERGEIIAEVETDKATMELESFGSGTLLETRANPGDAVPVGSVIAVVGEAAGMEQTQQPQEAERPQPAAPAPQPPPAEPEKEPAESTAGGGGPEQALRSRAGLEELGEGVTAAARPESKRMVPPPSEAEERPAARPEAPAEPGRASPLVRRLARERGIDLARVSGSGPDGRVLQSDLETLPPEKTGTPPAPGGQQPLSRMRKAIARKVSEAWGSIPHFTVTVAIGMGEAERLRKQLKAAGKECSINDLVIKATALALLKFPLLNASFSQEAVTVHPEININVAVALDEGLLMPVIKGCGSLSLLEIAHKSREAVTLARSGRASEELLSGGTFSVSNLGSFGVEEFMAVIYPGQAGILAVSAVRDQPVVRDGHIAAGRIMKVTLSADHRLVDGAYGAKFLQEVKNLLENPVHMLL
jgi:pyruvate dehydrogenase E2 component (dihydrolipoamide acetyltransferase)